MENFELIVMYNIMFIEKSFSSVILAFSETKTFAEGIFG